VLVMDRLGVWALLPRPGDPACGLAVKGLVAFAGWGEICRGDRKRCVHLGDGCPDGSGVLPVSLAEVFAGLRGELFGAAEMFLASHRHSRCLVVRYWSDTGRRRPPNWLGTG
jgi:hypothetical protein